MRIHEHTYTEIQRYAEVQFTAATKAGPGWGKAGAWRPEHGLQIPKGGRV